MIEQLQWDLEHIDLGLEEAASGELHVDHIAQLADEVERAITRIDVLPVVQDLRRARGLPSIQGVTPVVDAGKLLRALDGVSPENFVPTYQKKRHAWRSAIEGLRGHSAAECLSKSPAMVSVGQKFELYCTGVLPLSRLWTKQLDVVEARAEKLGQMHDGRALKTASDALTLACSAAVGTVSAIQATGEMLDTPRHTITKSRAVEACWRSFYTLSPADRTAQIDAAIAQLALVDIQVRLVEHFCLTSSDTLSAAWSQFVVE